MNRIRRGPALMSAALMMLGAAGVAIPLFAGDLLVPTARAAPADERIVIGVVLELTGENAPFGREASDAILLEKERVNEEGGVGGTRIQVIKMDATDRPENAARAVARLAKGYGAVAVIGPTGYRATLAAGRVAEKEKIPLLSLTSNEAVLEPVRPWIFSLAQTGSLSARRILLHMRFRKIHRAALLVSSDKYGAGGRESFRTSAPEMNVSLLMDERFPDGEHNFLPYLQRADRRGVEAFVLWALGPSQLAVLRQRLALDLEMPVYMASAVSRWFRLKGGGKSAEGVLFPASRVQAVDLLPRNDFGRAAVLAFRAAFRRRFGRDPDGYAGYAADALRLLVRAIRFAGPGREKIRKSIESHRPYNGLTGRYRFSERNHNGLDIESFVMVRIRGGKWTLERTAPPAREEKVAR